MQANFRPCLPNERFRCEDTYNAMSIRCLRRSFWLAGIVFVPGLLDLSRFHLRLSSLMLVRYICVVVAL